MNGSSAGKVAYVKGQTYTSERDGCITDEQGNTAHWWADSDINKTIPAFFNYFEPLSIKPSETITLQNLRIHHANQLREIKMQLMNIVESPGVKDVITFVDRMRKENKE